MAKLENETTSQVDNEAVKRKQDGLLKRGFNNVTSSLGHVVGKIAKTAAKGALIYGGARVVGATAKNIYEAASGNTVEYSGPFSKDGFNFSVTKGQQDVVQVRDSAIVDEPVESSYDDSGLDLE